MGKKSGSGSGMNNPDDISESLETIFWVLMGIRDPGWKKFGSGINIPDPQHCLNKSANAQQGPESLLDSLGKYVSNICKLVSNKTECVL
jgi:hypothetical protein